MPKRASAKAAAAQLPLPALLSQALVAFTIEFDNEFEHRTPHRTTVGASKQRGAVPAGSARSPWLLSLAMWALFLRFVPERGITVRELLYATSLDKQALRSWLVRLGRWGYLTIAPDLTASQVMPPPGDWIVRPTPGGLKARQVWQRLFAVIEKRWRERFGSETVDTLRASLAAIVAELDLNLPEYLPILGYGLRANLDRYAMSPPRPDARASALNLPALLAQVLLAFTIDFERESELSLAICANILRVLSDEGVRVRDLPRLSGVSAEAIKMATGFLGKGAYVVVETESPASWTKLIRLTAKGFLAQDAYRRRVAAIEGEWQARFGAERMRTLSQMLEQIAGDGTAEGSPLFRGLEPYPEGWRASLPTPETLPHYPMVLHRGGYPDGS